MVCPKAKALREIGHRTKAVAIYATYIIAKQSDGVKSSSI